VFQWGSNPASQKNTWVCHICGYEQRSWCSRRENRNTKEQLGCSKFELRNTWHFSCVALSKVVIRCLVINWSWGSSGVVLGSLGGVVLRSIGVITGRRIRSGVVRSRVMRGAYCSTQGGHNH
jgi:hypothetical protein